MEIKLCRSCGGPKEKFGPYIKPHSGVQYYQWRCMDCVRKERRSRTYSKFCEKHGIAKERRGPFKVKNGRYPYKWICVQCVREYVQERSSRLSKFCRNCGAEKVKVGPWRKWSDKKNDYVPSYQMICRECKNDRARNARERTGTGRRVLDSKEPKIVWMPAKARLKPIHEWKQFASEAEKIVIGSWEVARCH